MSPQKNFFNTCATYKSAIKTAIFLVFSLSLFLSPVGDIIKDNSHTSLIYTAFAESDGGSGGDAGAEGGMGGDGGNGNNAPAFVVTFSPTPTVTLSSTNINGIAVYFTPPTATLSISGSPIDYLPVSCSKTSGSVFPIGSTSVTCSAYNYYTGETVITSYAVVINYLDQVIPVIILNGSSTVTVAQGSTFTDPGATALDNYNGNITSQIVRTGSVNTSIVGTYTLSYDVKDNANNAAVTRTRTINVSDQSAPTLTLIGSATTTIQVGSVYIDAGATATDGINGNISGSITATSTLNRFVPGTYTITYFVTDTAGNSAVPVIRTILVVDTQAPTITLNGSSTQVISVGSPYVELGATAVDNVDSGLVVQSNSLSVNTLVVGSYSVTYSVTDSHGNVASPVTRIISVTDTVRPVITLNGSSTIIIPVGGTYSELGTVVTDNYSIGLLSTSTGAVNTNTVGTYVITYNATDTNGNTATPVTRTVQVTDNQIPVITLNGSSTVVIQIETLYVESGAVVTDNYDTLLSPTINASLVNISAVGSYTVTYNAIDSSGNNAVTVTRTVQVVDTQIPVITLNGSSTQTISVGSVYTELGATVTDNVSLGLTPIINSSTVTTSVVGTYTVTYNAVDGQGNPAVQVTRLVNVVDSQVPVITLNGSSTQTIAVGSVFTDLGATVIDNYDTGLLTVSSGTVNTSLVGVYTITYSATDSSGNAATPVARTITVVDSQAPLITLLGSNPQIILIGTPYTELGATTSDNYDTNLTPSIDSTGVNTNVTGTYLVTYTVTDSNGNSAIPVIRTITVVDTQAPIITLLGNNPQIISVGNLYVEQGTTVSDNLDTGLVASVDSSSLNTNIVGTYSVIYSVTDSSGNTATATRTINVVDMTPPVITLNGSSTINLFVGDVYSELGATVTDNVDATSSATVVGNVDTSTTGNYPIIYIATDAAGNHATNVTRTVIVSNPPVIIPDTLAPIVTLNGGSTIQVLVGGVYNEQGATAFDIVDGTTTVNISGSVDVNATGTYTVLYTSTDVALNVGSTTRTVTVVDAITPDTQAPIITVNGTSTINLFVGDIYTELGATAVDLQDGTFAATSTGSVDTNTPGTYTITYGATDAAGNAGAEVTRSIIVTTPPIPDTQAPVITLNGSSTVNLFVGDTYSELGAIVTDNVDATSTATVVGNVDTTTPGNYPIIYIATDAAGNQATNVTRTVIITAPIVIPLSQTSAINSTINGIYFGTSTLTLAQAIAFGITGTTTISNSTIASSTLNNATIINSDLTNCSITDALVKNYQAADCSVSNTIVDPPSGLNDLTGTTATSSEIFVSDVTYSNITGSYISTSTITTSTLTDSTSTDSIIATSTILDSTIASSTVITSTTTDSIIDSSIITSSNVTTTSSSNSTVTDTQLTNSTTTSSTIASSSLADSTVTSSTIATSSVNNATVTVADIGQSTIASSTANTSTINNSTVTNTIVATSTIADSTVDSSSITNGTVTNTDASASQITDSTVATSTLDQATVTNSTTDTSTVTASTITDSTVTDSTISTTTETASTVVNSTVTDSTVVSSTVTNSNVDTSTVTNTPVTDSTITNSTATDSTVTDSTVTNATTTDSTITSGTISSSEVTGSTIATSTVDTSTVNITIIDTATVIGSTTTDTTVTNSTVTNSNTNTANVTDSTISGSIVASSTITSSVVETSTLTDASVTNSTLTNSTLSQASSTESTITNSTLTSSTVATSTVASSTVTTATVTDSTITQSIVDNSTTTNSVLANASTTNSTLTDSAISDTTIASSTVASSTIDSSIVTNSTTTDSILTNSTTTNVTLSGSTLIGTILSDSTLTNSTTTNTTIANSTIENAVLTNATVLNDVITSGTIFTSGTTTTITATTSLADIINYAPLASFTTVTSGLSATFTDTSSDKNSGTSLTDAWSYFWNFGDGTGATTTSTTLGTTQTHTYSLTGLYNVILTLIDGASNTSTKNSLVQVTAPAPIPSSGGGGGSSGISSVSGGGYFVNTMNQPVASPFIATSSPLAFTFLSSDKKATTTLATSTKAQVKNKATVTKKKVVVKKPVAVKKVTTVSKATPHPTLWNKVVSFIKKFSFGN